MTCWCAMDAGIGDEHEWVQPQVPVLQAVDVTTFFWDLSYLWDVFREKTDKKHGFKF